MAWSTAAIASALLLINATNVFACQCLDVLESDSGSNLASDREKKAQNIIRGRVVDFRAGSADSLLKSSVPGINLDEANIAGMNLSGNAKILFVKVSIVETVKRNTKGEVKVITGMGTGFFTSMRTGDCGVPALFLYALSFDKEIEFEITPIGNESGLYYTGICSFFKDVDFNIDAADWKPLPPIE